MLIQEFLTFWEKNQPDVITGWNTEFFDIPYLCNRIKNLYEPKPEKEPLLYKDKETFYPMLTGSGTGYY